MQPLLALRALLHNVERRTNARWWIGNRPATREGQLTSAIAREVGLPTFVGNISVGDYLVPLSRAEAAHVLAVAGTTSLAYGRARPRSGAVRDASEALAGFAENASFFSNGRWDNAPSISWISLTTATFECGVIGYDDEQAFIFWVEEED